MQAAHFADDWREDQVILPINIHYFWLASQYYDIHFWQIWHMRHYQRQASNRNRTISANHLDCWRSFFYSASFSTRDLCLLTFSGDSLSPETCSLLFHYH